MSAASTIVVCIAFSHLFKICFPEINSFMEWFLKAMLVFVGGNIFGIIYLHNNQDFLFYKELILKKLT